MQDVHTIKMILQFFSSVKTDLFVGDGLDEVCMAKIYEAFLL